MRADEEIIKRIIEILDDDFFGFETMDLIYRLGFKDAKQFLVDGPTLEKWRVLKKDNESIIAEMKNYMGFAWSKANNERGLSACRSIGRYEQWLWLINKLDIIDGIEYEHYGKEILVAICEHFKFDWKALDNGERVN